MISKVELSGVNTSKFDNEVKTLEQEKAKYIQQYLNKIKKYKDIYLWGISESCDEAINFFNKNKIIIKSGINKFEIMLK